MLSSTDGILYVMMQGPTDVPSPITVVAAFDPNREVTLRLKPYDLAKGVLVQQIDALRYDPNPDPNTANNYWVSGTVGNGMIEGDAAAGTVTIKNMAAGQGRFSSSQSFFVTYTPRDRTQPVTVIVSPSARVQAVNNAAGDGEEADPALPRQDFSPLLWYYVLPGTPTSGLTRIGGTLYYGYKQNSVGGEVYGILGVDANPGASDPDVRPGEAIRNIADELTRFDQFGAPVTRTAAINHVRWVQPLTAPASSSPVAGPDVLAVNTTDGTFAFENSTTLVADQGRIIEVGGDGTPLWSMDTTVDYQVVGGNLPIFDPVNPVAGNGRQVFERKPLSHPSVARRLGSGDYLIADTGNNRLVRTNRGAQVTWELTRVNDPLKVLKSGETLSLSSPTDVQLYLHPTLDPGTGNQIGYEEHYLIADAGNYRLLEVVDYHNLDGSVAALGEHVVVWSTRTATTEGRRLRFKSAQRVLTTEGNVYGIPKVVATVDNANASGDGASVGADFTGGSLIRMDYRPANTYFLLRNATTGVPLAIAPWPVTGIPVGSGYPWPHVAGASDEPTGNGGIDKVLDVVTLKMGTLLPDGITPQPADYKYRITRPTFVNQIAVPGNNLAFLVCDVNGVYQIESDPTVAEPNRMSITWFFNQLDYSRINVNRVQAKVPLYDPIAQPMDIPFHPVSAQRLPNGNILIANAASGTSSLFDDGKFRGEVLEVTGGSRVGPTPSVPLFGNFSAPGWEVTGRTGPVRVKIRQRMGASSATQPLEQPLFADRL